MSWRENLASTRMFRRFVVASVFRRGGLLLTRRKTLASEEASYKFGHVKRSTGAVR
jgi:hypothetical protein